MRQILVVVAVSYTHLVVLLGAASKDLPFDESAWIKVIEENVKPKFVELNKKAFEMGRNA